MKEKTCNGVITEVEVLEMNERLGIAHCLKHVFKLIMACFQQLYGIAVSDVDTSGTKMSRHERVGRLCNGRQKEEAERNEYKYLFHLKLFTA